MKIVLTFASLLFLGCSIDASISDIESKIADIPVPSEKIQRTDSDFMHAEVVTTNNGSVVRGAFGEVGSTVNLPNGVSIMAVIDEN